MSHIHNVNRACERSYQAFRAASEALDRLIETQAERLPEERDWWQSQLRAEYDRQVDSNAATHRAWSVAHHYHRLQRA